MKVKVISCRVGLVEEQLNDFFARNKDKEFVDAHFTQNGIWVNIFVLYKQQ